MRKILKYGWEFLRDVLLTFTYISCLLLFFAILSAIITWDVSMYSPDRIWTEHTRAFLRLIAMMSVAISVFVRVKVTLTTKQFIK